MGCCFGSQTEEEPLLVPDQQTPSYNTNQVPNSPVNDLSNSTAEQPTRNKDEFMSVDGPSINVRPYNLDENSYQIRKHFKELTFKTQLPQVFEPISTLLTPLLTQQEVNQARQQSMVVGDIMRGMKPKCKEPISTVTLD